MKILIVSQYYYPEQFQINEIAPELVRRGHNVTVLCGMPNYPQGEIYDGYADPSKMCEIVNGVRIIRVKQRPRGHNIISLLLNYLTFVKRANVQVDLLDKDFDIVMGYQLSPITSMLPAMKYAKDNHAPLLLYVLDLWPVSGQSHLPVKRGLMFRWLSRMSRRIYCSADRILVTSRPFIKYLKQNNGIEDCKMGYLPQHADDLMLSMDLEKPHDDVTHFMYAGNIGAASALDVIVNAAAIIGLL